ncbi:MAG TPA: response regulator, partial [Polyangiaceae bacterium]|nr:response regulator [Polyangiaceae bacterium]
MLVVDDLAEVRRAHARLLQSGGFEVHQAKSADEALALVAQIVFDVVLTDVHMPNSNGVVLLRELRERDPELSVVLVSGSPDLPTALEAVQLGAQEYLTKPITREKLQETIQRAVVNCREKRGTRSEMERLRSGERTKQPLDAEPKRWIGVLLGGRYRLREVIGEGGMGVVYEANREDLGGMPVAVKLVHPDLRFDDSLLHRLRREAEALASIHHPNIVQVIDFQTPEDSPPFLVMELLSGVPLAETVAAAGPMAAPRVLSILQQVLSALSAAHARGIVHRDLKPENVFLTRVTGLGEVAKVLDFGIAKITEP